MLYECKAFTKANIRGNITYTIFGRKGSGGNYNKKSKECVKDSAGTMI